MAQLITLAEVKVALGIPAEQTGQDAKLSAAIDAASRAILTYTDRDFGSSNVIEARTFEYDGNGYLEIDDASAVTAVSLGSAGYETDLDSLSWEAQPHRGPVYTYLLLPYGRLYPSPAMGFKRNLDKYEPHVVEPTIATVTATWGFPTIPDDVKRAALWTAIAMSESPRPYTTESIADYSHSVAQAPTEAIPQRAIALLDPYRRVYA